MADQNENGTALRPLERRVMRTGDEAPEEGRPVLALIHYTHDLGPDEWREVVYHDGNEWRSFAGSDTFEDGERVVRWVYAEDVLP
jgi:hypothetical protein